MCAVCFGAVQLVPAAAMGARAMLVKRRMERLGDVSPDADDGVEIEVHAEVDAEVHALAHVDAVLSDEADDDRTLSLV